MALDKNSTNIEKQPNVLENEISWLDAKYIINKWEKYVRKMELIKEWDKKIRKASKTNDEKDFFDWQNNIEFISLKLSEQKMEENSEGNLWWFWLSLWKYKKALEFMMIIDVIVKMSKKIAAVRSEVASSLESGEYNENEEYQDFLRGTFLNEVDKFQRKYKKAFETESSFHESFEEIANCVAAYYTNKDVARVFEDVVLSKSEK